MFLRCLWCRLLGGEMKEISGRAVLKRQIAFEKECEIEFKKQNDKFKKSLNKIHKNAAKQIMALLPVIYEQEREVE